MRPALPLTTLLACSLGYGFARPGCMAVMMLMAEAGNLCAGPDVHNTSKSHGSDALVNSIAVAGRVAYCSSPPPSLLFYICISP